MSPKTFRFVTPVALATASLAFAGCGGGSGGDESAYVKTYEGACKAISDATRDYTSSASSLVTDLQKDPNGAVKSLKEGVTKIFDTFGDQLQVMADADAPKKWEDFQKSVSDAAGDAKKGIDQAKDAVSDVKSPQDFSKLGQAFQDIDLGKSTQKMPKDLADKAPSCKAMGGGTAS